MLLKVLERAGQVGPVLASMGRSRDLCDKLWDSYVDTMKLVLGILLGERSDAVFTSADLRGIGVDDTEPRES
ncbi:hypothetical protein DL991_09400 [Amycolatopsis sp. WAC 01375]|uniref:hypothetical protein n=1 Tax=Amycolatopsis sp. WAC 01375 TaxID=2203194 RepID=UPI000F78A945|nr:hypothetical protein [Amycolatopsis sp. WAC 01375]RSM81154.1 hypothetical protein DL991_09400 [Amycolatopsis sp. WAC 01375]